MNNNNNNNKTDSASATATSVISADEARVEHDIEGRINIFPQGPVQGPLRVEIFHYHHYAPTSSKKNGDGEIAGVPDAATSSLIHSPSGLAETETVHVRLSIPDPNKKPLTFIGLESDGSVTSTAGPTDASLFELIDRGGSDGARHISLRNVLSNRNLRVNAKGVVDIGGGFGRWTLFDIKEDGNLVTLRSVANEKKLNTLDNEGWFLSLDPSGKVIGNGAPFPFILEKCDNVPKKPLKEKKAAKEAALAQRMATKAQRDAERIAAREALIATAKEARIASKAERMAAAKEANMSAKAQRDAERIAAKEARIVAAKEARIAAKAERIAKITDISQQSATVTETSELKGNWTLVLKTAKPKSVVPMSAITVVPVLAEFPREGIVSLSPLAFFSSQNRRGGSGWNLGVSPSGFLVVDASQNSSWGRWKVISTDDSVSFQSVHTDGFHLGISQDRLIRHNSSGDFIKFIPERVSPHGFILRCAAHVDAYLAVNSSGILYACSTAESKDAIFIASPLPEVHED